MYDIIIIGMGPAGISAAIYLKRSNLKVLILEKSAPGGLLNTIDKIENYPGFSSITGPDLAYQMLLQIKENAIDYRIEEVIDIKNQDLKIITTTKNEYKTANIIIASGRVAKTLNLDQERTLIGRGISTCAICDGFFYKNKDIAIVGGGNSALQEALYLSKIVKNITILIRSSQLKAEDNLIQKVKQTSNINILYNSQITALKKENDKLAGIEINNKEILEVAGVFVYIGYNPNNNFVLSEVKRDNKGYLKVNNNYETNIKGIYAIGSAIDIAENQIVTACATGAIVALHIAKNNK